MANINNEESRHSKAPKSALLGLGIVFVLLILMYIHFGLRGYHFDDAYIHMRISQNFEKFGFPFFNENEALKVGTSTGWIIFLSSIIKIFGLGDKTILPLVIGNFNVFFTVVGAVFFTASLIYLSGNRHQFLFYTTFFVLYVALLLPSSIGLMEIPLSMALAGIAIYLLIKKNPSSFIFFAIAVSIRPELLILFGLAFAYVVIKKVFATRSAILFSSAATLPFVLFDLIYFRTIIPSSIRAKSIIYDVSSSDSVTALFCDLAACETNFQIFGQSFALLVFLSSLVLFFALIVHFGLMVTRNLRSSKADHKMFALAKDFDGSYLLFLWSIFTFLAYLFFETLIFPWYVPLFSVPFFMSVFLAFGNIDLKSFHKTFSILAIPVIFSIVTIIPEALSAAYVNPANYRGFSVSARTKTYIQWGKVLYENYPEAVLMSSEIGGLGYGFDGYIMDAVGLASPVALSYHPLSVPEQRSSGVHGSIPLRLVEDFSPDIIVSYDVFVEEFLFSEEQKLYSHWRCPVFVEGDLELTGTNTLWNSKYLNVFLKKGLVVSESFEVCEK
jgi:hypothetical protein